MRLAYQFQGQKVKDQGRHINADTHLAAYLPIRKYRMLALTAGCCFRRISRPFPYQFTPNSQAVSQVAQ